MHLFHGFNTLKISIKITFSVLFVILSIKLLPAINTFSIFSRILTADSSKGISVIIFVLKELSLEICVVKVTEHV